MTRLIDTAKLSAKYREKLLDAPRRRLLLTNFTGTEQECDLTVPPNCNGFGRVRHFRRATSDGWPANPLPIDPACRALGLNTTAELQAQVFQNAACNWRCWYCFVPFDLLSANPKHSSWLTPAQMIDLYLAEQPPPPMIDLTGGQPELVPEWILWVMQELKARGLEEKVYLWSDDSLSTDYFWQKLSEAEQEAVASYPKYGRVCCFKGFDSTSFSFNTSAHPELFDTQFELMRRLLTTGIDLYVYTTFTSPSDAGIPDAMRIFVDRLQELHPNLPLRSVPLEIRPFTPVKRRLNDVRAVSMRHQYAAIEAWNRELETRFSASERARSVVDVPLRTKILP